MNILQVIEWKFPNTPCSCSDTDGDGVLKIVKFGEGGEIPSQADQDLWTAEYNIYYNEIQRIQGIKDEAQARIISQLPEGSPDNFIIKQMNMLMLNAELDDIVINGGTLTIEQQALKDSFVSIKDAIKAIRDMSDIAEANGDSLVKFKSDLDLAGY